LRSKLVFVVLLCACAVTARAQAGTNTDDLILYGDLKGLADAAGMHTDVAADSFLLEYNRMILSHGGAAQPFDGTPLNPYLQGLSALSRQANGGAQPTFTFDARGLRSFMAAKAALKAFGIELHAEAVGDLSAPRIEHVRVELGTTADDIAKQPLLGALAVDFSTLQHALETQGHIEIPIPHVAITAVAGARFWLKATNVNSATDLLAAFIDRQEYTRLYVALATMAPEARDIIQKIPADRLLKRHSEILLLYGSSLSIRNGQAVLPGGTAAASNWERL